MSHTLKGYTPAEYFKLHGTLPADVIEEMLADFAAATNKLEKLKDLVDSYSVPALGVHSIEWYAEFHQSFSECAKDVASLPDDSEVKQGFTRLKEDLDTVETHFNTHFEELAELHKKLEDLT